MTKIENAGAAPVSKYAAKKRERINFNVAGNKPAIEDAGTQTAQVAPVEAPANTAPRGFNKREKINGLPAVTANFPEHVVAVALIIKNNAEIRRFTALGILNYLLQKKEIAGDKRYVSFKWNKFAVKCNGLMREYSYNEPFFLNALVAAFSSFSASAQRVIDAFCKKEMSIGIAKAVDQEEVENIVALNEDYQGNGDEAEEGADD